MNDRLCLRGGFRRIEPEIENDDENEMQQGALGIILLLSLIFGVAEERKPEETFPRSVSKKITLVWWQSAASAILLEIPIGAHHA